MGEGTMSVTEALDTLRARCPGYTITLCYHPDADPGDGSGWVVEVGEITYYADGTRDGVLREALDRRTHDGLPT